MAGFREGVSRFRSAPRAGDERRGHRSADEGCQADPPSRQTPGGSRQRRRGGGAGGGERERRRLSRRVAGRQYRRAVGRPRQAFLPSRRRLRPAIPAHGRQGHVRFERLGGEGAQPLGRGEGRSQRQGRPRQNPGSVQWLGQGNRQEAGASVDDPRGVGGLMADRAIRGRVLTFRRAPAGAGDAGSYAFLPDGIVLVKDGRVEAVGPTASLLPRLGGAPVDHFPDKLILPGFIDTHIHFPQTQVIASYGAQLLEWLEKYTFVEEQKYADAGHAARNAEFFLDELARSGTTTACCYGSVHAASVEALFAAAEKRGAGMIAGTAIMDRNGPQALLDVGKDSVAASRDLIKRWHGKGRQRYAVTPRFAVTSTEAQLAACGALLHEFSGVYMQTHLAENPEEIATTRRLFPNDPSYTSVYARAGLLGPRALLGHCIHLDDSEVALLRDTQSVA